MVLIVAQRVKHRSNYMNTDKILSPQQFRNLANISRATEYRWNAKNCLPPRVIINGYFLGYRESDFLTWLNENTKQKPK